jgi:3D (Asp-Asp-Asp) domain-containing protein
MRNKILALAASAFLYCCPAGARVRSKVIVMEATAFARAHQATAAGTAAHDGIVAADPHVLPLGTRIRILGDASYAGNYLVTDTGSAIKGRHIDLYFPSQTAAKRFGTKTVRVRILKLGTGKADARAKDEAAASHPK